MILLALILAQQPLPVPTPVFLGHDMTPAQANPLTVPPAVKVTLPAPPKPTTAPPVKPVVMPKPPYDGQR